MLFSSVQKETVDRKPHSSVIESYSYFLAFWNYGIGRRRICRNRIWRRKRQIAGIVMGLSLCWCIFDHPYIDSIAVLSDIHSVQLHAVKAHTNRWYTNRQDSSWILLAFNVGLTELCCLSMHEESVLIPFPQDKATGENRHAEETPAVQYMLLSYNRVVVKTWSHAEYN